MTNTKQALINELMDNLQQMADDADSSEERNTITKIAYLLQAKSAEINKQKKVKPMKQTEQVGVIGKVEFVVYKKENIREDGMELVELANRIHPMLVVMNKLVLDMINGTKEEVEVLDVHIEWEEAFNRDGTHHSWFEMKDGVKHLVRAADVENKKIS